MNCPKCNSNEKVIKTRSEGPIVQRKRRCLNHRCGHVWETTELPTDTLKKLLAGSEFGDVLSLAKHL